MLSRGIALLTIAWLVLFTPRRSSIHAGSRRGDGTKEAVFAPALVLMLSLFSSTARAEFGEPYITPSVPLAGEQLLVNVPIYRIEYCDAIVHVGDYPIVTREGNTITILFNGVRYGALGEWCVYPPGIATHSFGTYPVGSYSLVVQLRYANDGGEWVVDTLGVVPFVVAPVVAETVAVPTWGHGFAIICMVLLSISGVFILRKRRALWMALPMAMLPISGNSSASSDRDAIDFATAKLPIGRSVEPDIATRAVMRSVCSRREPCCWR